MKKTPLIPLIGLFLPVLLAGPAVFADVAADLKQAEALYQAGQYTQAEEAYLTVMKGADPNKPADVEAAFNARKKLPSVYIATDRLPQAKEAVQQLLSQYAARETLPHAVHEIVEAAKPVYKLAQVRQLYQNMVAAKPDDPQTLWLKMGMAIASVHLTDDVAMDAMLQTITTQHAADARAAEALNHIAWACRNVQQYSKALSVYEYVVNNWPDKDRAAFAQHGIVICQLGFRNPQAADAALEVLLQKYGTDRNASKLLLWAGHAYSSAGETKRACEVFESLIKNYPSCEEVIEAQATLGILGVQMEDTPRIEAGLQALLTQYPVNEAKATGLRNMGGALVWKQLAYAHPSAQEQERTAFYNRCLLAIGNYVLANYPGTNAAMCAEQDLAAVAIQSGDDASAEAALGRLSTNYANDPETPLALRFLADYYLRMQKDSKAEVLYQYLVDKYPNHELAPVAKAGLAQVKIRQTDDAGAEAAFQKVLTGYPNHPRLAEAVNVMAEGYYLRAFQASGEQPSLEKGPTESMQVYLPKAIAKWELIVAQLQPHPQITPTAYYQLGLACSQLHNYEEAERYCATVAQQWPEDEHAWAAQLLMAKIYKEMIKAGLLPEPDGQAKIKTVCQELLEKYPTCPGAGTARRWLGQGNETDKGGAR